MPKFSYLLLLLFILSISVKAQIQKEVPVLTYEEVEQIIQQEDDKILVVNFWATTCAPCIKELPHFMEVNQRFKSNPKYKMLLVSLDRTKDMSRVLNFMKAKNIETEVVLLNDNKRMNVWIPRYDENWGGEIPVTVFYKKGQKVEFHNGVISKEELTNKINKYLN
ncbi:TlpA disulfide reductase family protein [Mesonia sp. K7]|uniref:TlpA family protein disulfide reductase n=1 Tax=Mesonia sp. K7 TaxID=2218606 RepID=UPI000DA889BB|nr:TlpA disulfide reductase family protein [Mesonia sp. K7]PZD79250.1 TlpA family protein disulfide reductase [Mesonia sp. K7]